MTLCIIDMQPQFDAANDELLIKSVAYEVEKSIDQREGIVVLEYCGFGHTNEELLDTIRSYDRQTTLFKSNDDGSDELISTVFSLNFWPHHIKFCGVNTCYCVWETLWGSFFSLKDKDIDDFKLELLIDSTRCTCEGNCDKKYEDEIERLQVKDRILIK